MASELSSPSLSSIFFLFLLLPFLSHAKSFESLKNLQGRQKGDKVTGLRHLKLYLSHYGYLKYNDPNSLTAQEDAEDEFDEQLEAALKTYQQNYHLNATGTLDAETVSMMMMPRCGVPDITNGVNWMRPGYHGADHSPKKFHVVGHYAFFPNLPRWPADKTDLTYAFLPTVPNESRGEFAKAFDQWASASQYFTFSETEDRSNADLNIGFFSGDHNDNYPFDGPGGVLAHSFAPADGRCHFDADETWTVGGIQQTMDYETVALHEIGHLLGLGHSNVREAIMWPSTSPGERKGLSEDDIQGLKYLYNLG